MRLCQAALAFVAASAFAAGSTVDWVRQVESARNLVEAGDFDHAEALFAAALKQAETAGDDLRIAVVQQNLGGLFDRRGHLLQAENRYLRAIQAIERSPLTDDRLLVRTSAALTGLYVQTGQFAKAESLTRRLLSDHPDADDTDKASLMVGFGVILAHKHRPEEAEQIFHDTVRLYSGTSDPAIREIVATAIANMAGIQVRRGRKSEGMASYRQALTMMEALPTQAPAPFVTTLADYAGVLRAEGARSAADSLYRRAIAIAEARLGAEHAILGALYHEYSGLLRETGRKSEARSLAARARRIRMQSDRENLTGHTVPVEALSFSR
jgi:tetratricopeptide (TPR) repeat protein